MFSLVIRPLVGARYLGATGFDVVNRVVSVQRVMAYHRSRKHGNYNPVAEAESILADAAHSEAILV